MQPAFPTTPQPEPVFAQDQHYVRQRLIELPQVKRWGTDEIAEAGNAVVEVDMGVAEPDRFETGKLLPDKGIKPRYVLFQGRQGQIDDPGFGNLIRNKPDQSTGQHRNNWVGQDAARDGVVR